MLAAAQPRPALGHTQLIASSPTAGDTLAASPAAIRLEFSGSVEAALSEIRLITADGRSFRLTLRGAPGETRALEARLPVLRPGAYRVAWRVVAADGHPIADSFVFYLAPAGSGGGTAGAEFRPPPPERAAAEGASRSRWVATAGLRGLATGALMALAGTLLFVVRMEPVTSPPAIRIARALVIAAPLLLTAHVVAWLMYVSPDAGIDGSVVGRALETTPGRVEALRLGLALLALWALGLARRPGIAAACALAAVATTGALGHTAGGAPGWSIPLKSLHVAAASIWLGGLLILVAGLPGAEEFRGVAHRVSSLALGAVIVIALTGILQTLLILPAAADLVRSTYGLLVLGKAVGLAALVVFGFRNRFGLLPALPEASGRLRGSVRLETLLMGAVILLAGFLAYVPPPVTP